MTQKEFNKVDRDKFLAIAEAAGLSLKEGSAYAKLTFGDSPAKIYVARTQRVTRVDLSKFTIEHDGVQQISREEAAELKIGLVQSRLDFTKDEETVLAAFTEACEALKLVPPEKKKERALKKEVEVKSEELEEQEENTESSSRLYEVVARSENELSDDDDDLTELGAEFEVKDEPTQEALI